MEIRLEFNHDDNDKGDNDDDDDDNGDDQVRDGEMVAVELVARDTRGSLEAVLSLGCIQYDSTR